MDITKIIIPAAGIGTRFLPFTKAVPKEMLPLLNKPAIQYIVEEGLAAGIQNFICITNKGKEVIANHFDSCIRLENFLKDACGEDCLADLNKIIRLANFAYIRQSVQLGLGHAIGLAESFIDKEYFGIMLPNDVFASKASCMSQIIKLAYQEKASIIAVQEVPPGLASSYNMIAIKKQLSPNLFQVSHIVENPNNMDTPSNLAIAGRYVLSNKVFGVLKEMEPDANEVSLSNAISTMIKRKERVFAYRVQGMRYDISTPIGWLKAVIGLALQDPKYASHVKKFISEIDTVDSFLYNQTKTIEHSLE